VRPSPHRFCVCPALTVHPSTYLDVALHFHRVCVCQRADHGCGWSEHRRPEGGRAVCARQSCDRAGAATALHPQPHCPSTFCAAGGWCWGCGVRGGLNFGLEGTPDGASGSPSSVSYKLYASFLQAVPLHDLHESISMANVRTTPLLLHAVFLWRAHGPRSDDAACVRMLWRPNSALDKPGAALSFK